MSEKRVSVCCVVVRVRPRLQILLGRHRQRGWENTGGKVEATETVREALNREVLEETGYRVQSVDPIIGPYLYETPRAPEWVALVYSLQIFADWTPPEQPPEPDVHSEWRWVDTDTALQMEDLAPHARDTILLVYPWLAQ